MAIRLEYNIAEVPSGQLSKKSSFSSQIPVIMEL